jgi:hypothetical protein
VARGLEYGEVGLIGDRTDRAALECVGMRSASAKRVVSEN